MEATGKLFKISKVTQHTFGFHYSLNILAKFDENRTRQQTDK